MKQGEIEEGKIRAPKSEFHRSDCVTKHENKNSIEFYSFHSFANQMSKIDAVLGSQWGDEGKGKLVDTIGNQ